MQWVNSCEVKPVVVVDSFAGFSDGADENDAAQVRAFMDGPRRLTDMGATVIVLHNSSVKTDTAKEYRGSSDFKASVDIAYHLVNLSSDPSRLSTLRLRAFKARFAVAPEIVLNYVDGEFRIDSREPTQTGIQAFRDLTDCESRYQVARVSGVGCREGTGP
jgi:RecA-family ATPase